MKKLSSEAEKRGAEITGLETEIADLESKLDDLEHKVTFTAVCPAATHPFNDLMCSVGWVRCIKKIQR
jgi:hypothetical protein